MKTLVGKRVNKSGKTTHYVFLRKDMDFDTIEVGQLSAYMSNIFDFGNARMVNNRLVCTDTHLSLLPDNLQNTIHIVAEVISNNVKIGYKVLVSGNLELAESSSIIAAVVDKGYTAVNFKIHQNAARAFSIKAVKGDFRKLELVTKQ